MDLINQYLRAVAAQLPPIQRDDIAAELRDIILSRIEARERVLGRRLDDNEIEEELRVIGHPILVAARYREEPQHLVGPSLYPYWMFAVKIAIAIQGTAVLVLLIVRTVNGQDFGNALGHAIGQGVSGFVTLIGVATVAAWAIERRMIHVAYLDHWRVRDLHVLEYAGWDFSDLLGHFRKAQAPRAATTEQDVHVHHYPQSPVSQGLFMVAFGTVFLLWWVGLIHLPLVDQASARQGLAIDTTLGGMSISDIHGMLFWPVLLYGTAVIVQGTLTLIYPNTVWLRGLMAFLMGAILLGFCVWVWTASPIAAVIRVDSFADLLLKLKQDLHSRPVALAPLITLFLGCAAFGAVVNIVRGLWEILLSSRRSR